MKEIKKIVLFDTSIGSLNMGDHIINESVEKELISITNNNFLVKFATHTPVSHFYQNLLRNKTIKYIDNANYKFIAGTNLLNTNLFLPWGNWNVNIFNSRPYSNSILVGVGMNSNSMKANIYTKKLLRKVLSNKYIHSTRDERTKKFLENMGYKAINTGCATIWSLTTSHCNKIPQTKSDNVVFTLTDYCRDEKKDQMLINILNKNYKKVYYWIQGSDDYDYISNLKNIDNIELVSPSLECYRKILNSGVDYVGTRLHAGIYAMKYKCRAIILAVDNRARDMKKTYNLNVIERDNIENSLEKMINSKFATNVNINEKAIKQWKKQFH